MKYEYILLLSKSNFGRHFLTRSYSFEMLIILFESHHIVGIEQLYATLQSKKSKMPAFLSFLAYLESRQCIIKLTNNNKKSQRVIALTPECRQEIKAILTGNQSAPETSGCNISEQHTVGSSY